MDTSPPDWLKCFSQLVEQNSALMKKIALLEADRERLLKISQSCQQDNPSTADPSTADITQLSAELMQLKDDLEAQKEATQKILLLEEQQANQLLALCTVLTEENVPVAAKMKLLKEQRSRQETTIEKEKKEQEDRHSQAILKFTEDVTSMRTEMAAMRAKFEGDSDETKQKYTQQEKHYTTEIQTLKEIIERNEAKYNQQCIQIQKINQETQAKDDEIKNLLTRMGSLENKLEQPDDNFRKNQHREYRELSLETQRGDSANHLCSGNNQLSQQPETIDLLRRFLEMKLQKKYVAVTKWEKLLSESNVEFHGYDNFGTDTLNLKADSESYNKELFLIIGWYRTYVENSLCKHRLIYFYNQGQIVSSHKRNCSVSCRKNSEDMNQVKNRNLLSLCQHWKKIKPYGEVHCLYYQDCALDIAAEVISAMDTCHKLEGYDEKTIVNGMREHWPQFANQLLSNNGKRY